MVTQSIVKPTYKDFTLTENFFGAKPASLFSLSIIGNARTLSLLSFSITTLSMTGLFATLRITDTQQNSIKGIQNE